MAHYVDGFVLPVPKKNLAAYRRMAQKASRIFRDLGALEYRECAGEDLNVKMGLPFPRGIKTKPGETVVFSWITWPSRQVRDQGMKKVMEDPRMQPGADMPFDGKRMIYGGFETIVEA